MRDLREAKIGKEGAKWFLGGLSSCDHGLSAETTSRLITLNGMKASEEITEEQARQVGLPWHGYSSSMRTKLTLSLRTVDV